MTIELYRVDERLIHGQVVIGWGSQLHPQQYVVVDDAVAVSEWEQDLYALGLPDGVTVEFLTTEAALARLPALRESEVRTILLTRSIETILRLAEGGSLNGATVNLGGIHHGPGRTQVLPYLYLDDADVERLREIERMGVSVRARDLPGSRSVDLAHLIP